jgi:cyclopropane-fatty-acyl-phospholipid synthase
MLTGGEATRTGIFEKTVRRAFRDAGVILNGPGEADIRVHDPRLYRRIVLEGSLGMGEAYMDGWWDCPRLDQLFTKILQADIKSAANSRWPSVALTLKAIVKNCQSQRRAFQVGEQHYDLGNDIYTAMLDSRMVYTCAYWKNAANLEEAQANKLDLVCRKIGLQPGHRVLDVGCGWGGFAQYAAKHYRAEVVGITVSREQADYAARICAGLPVEIRLQDYRDCRAGEFDRVVSLGMMEHVGQRNYRKYMEMITNCLRPGGLALVQVIGTHCSMNATDPWLDKYIFPNSMLPSVKQFGKAIDGLLKLQDWHAFGQYYDKTLMAWYENFETAWDTLAPKYGDRFHRMWRYYLLLCAGIFRSGEAQLWQVVMSKGALPGCYETVR